LFRGGLELNGELMGNSITFILINETVKNNAREHLESLQANGKAKVTFSASGKKQDAQRGLQWMWNKEIEDSGIGSHDTAKEVHLFCKTQFAAPILFRDNEHIRGLWELWYEKYKNDADRLLWFHEHVISTEDLNVSQMAEYLTDMQRYYIPQGVQLTNPNDRGLLNE